MAHNANSRPQFSLAALMGAVIACSVIFGFLANMDTAHHVSIRCQTLPADDRSLTKWYEAQDRVTDVVASREADVVHVRFAKRFGTFELLTPPLADLGYTGLKSMENKVSQPSVFGAALIWITKVPVVVWFGIAALSVALLVATIKRNHTFGAILVLLAAEALPAGALELHMVPLPVESPRLLGMSMDDDGFIWLGSTHRVIYRYDPRSGQIEEIKLPFDSSTSQTNCVGNKVYLLGQSYPKLIIYDRAARAFSQAEYPSAKPDVWYGTQVVDARHLYLFDRGSAGVIRWDTSTDTGKTIPYSYPTILPSGGQYVSADRAVWCQVWDYHTGQYIPVGIARLDATTNEFNGWFPFPKEDAKNEPFTDPAATIFYPHTLKGKLVPFDFKQRRWCQPIAVPEYGKRFGFIGLGTVHDGRWYFSISTYNGTEIGCDGKPYHFCNGLLEFDPQTGKFALPSLETADAYYQVSYHLSFGGHFYATGNNIREADGTLNQGKLGRAVFWQTRQVEGQ